MELIKNLLLTKILIIKSFYIILTKKRKDMTSTTLKNKMIKIINIVYNLYIQ